MNPYPKSSPQGGTLIRKVMAQFKEQGFPLPIAEPILIAVSGGLDSMALAHLIIRYGRKIIAPELVTLLHFDHAWRPESATTEREGVSNFAQSLGVKFLPIDLAAPAVSRASENLEEDARLKRIEKYESLAGVAKGFRYVFTAHHQDDLAETLFWRFLRGEFNEYRAGVLFQDSCVLRPFLKVSKELLKAYISEEKVPIFEDPSNRDTRAFRAWYREAILPELQKKFPNLNQTLARYAEMQAPQLRSPILEAVQLATSEGLNRAQRKAIQEMLQSSSIGSRLSLPGGVLLTRVETGFLIENLDDTDRI